MAKEIWEIWLEDEERREKDFQKYLKNKKINKEEIEMISKTTIEKEEVLYYIEAKDKRNKASYSTLKIFDDNEVETLRIKAISFVNKVKEIIEFFQSKK